MKTAGIIVEYNPLHNGHIHHINETKRITDCDILIAVMSGNFLQRGEPAILPKYERAKLALQVGVDIVIELPYAHATQKAETFARGAISILQSLHVQEVCFGSESGNVDDFLVFADHKQKAKQEIDDKVQNQMKKGVSYPKALSTALAEVINSPLDVSLPNNILGVHYIEEIQKLNSNIIPKTIKRYNVDYHDTTFRGNIASATGVRKTLLEQKMNVTKISSVVPNFTVQALEDYMKSFHTVHFWELYFPFLQHTLLTKSAEELRAIYEVGEGLENRLLTHIANSHCFEEFMQRVKTKRYTRTRLQRLSTHILTNTTKKEMGFTEEHVPYLKLLGMTGKGQEYLSSIKKNIPVPLVANNKSFHHPLLTLDEKATAAYYSVLPSPLRLQAIRDEWNAPPLIVH